MGKPMRGHIEDDPHDRAGSPSGSGGKPSRLHVDRQSARMSQLVTLTTVDDVVDRHDRADRDTGNTKGAQAGGNGLRGTHDACPLRTAHLTGHDDVTRSQRGLKGSSEAEHGDSIGGE